jgi:small GTP-binding protein domain
LERLQKLLDTAEYGKILKEGIRTVIVGKPNAGKSSLLNILAGEDRAIVTDVAGTTRDALEETIRLDGVSLRVVDTAGIRSTEDIVEKIGVEKARKYALDADLLIYIVDGSVPLDESDDEILRMIAKKKTIILLNKSDLDMAVTEEILKEKIKTVFKEMQLLSKEGEVETVIIRTSTKEKVGIGALEEKVKEMFFHGEVSFNDEVVITNMRHKEAMQDAYESMMQVKASLEKGMPEDFYSIDLMSAYASLGKIIGEEVGEDLVNEIFSKFCMGK